MRFVVLTVSEYARNIEMMQSMHKFMYFSRQIIIQSNALAVYLPIGKIPIGKYTHTALRQPAMATELSQSLERASDFDFAIESQYRSNGCHRNFLISNLFATVIR